MSPLQKPPSNRITKKFLQCTSYKDVTMHSVCLNLQKLASVYHSRVLLTERLVFRSLLPVTIGRKFDTTTLWHGWSAGLRIFRAPLNTSCLMPTQSSRYRKCVGFGHFSLHSSRRYCVTIVSVEPSMSCVICKCICIVIALFWNEVHKFTSL